MKIVHEFMTATLTSLAALWLASPTAVGQDDLTKLLARLKGQPFDEAALYALEAHTADPRIVPALETAFVQRDQKKEKQAVALALLRLGDKSDTYFDFLAGFARQAIEDRTPFFIKFDASGHEIKGQFSAEFENWCSLYGKDPKSVAAVQFGVYPQDVMALAQAQDPRAIALLRRGLDSPNPLVLVFSVQGLGRLQDNTVMPLIVKASEHLPRSAARSVAMELPWFSNPEADALMARLVPDRQTRDFYVGQVQQLRAAELKRVLSRAGKAPQN